jgi:hypothetical protein
LILCLVVVRLLFAQKDLRRSIKWWINVFSWKEPEKQKYLAKRAKTISWPMFIFRVKLKPSWKLCCNFLNFV